VRLSEGSDGWWCFDSPQCEKLKMTIDDGVSHAGHDERRADRLGGVEGWHGRMIEARRVLLVVTVTQVSGHRSI
jgi:hypothetical protein